MVNSDPHLEALKTQILGLILAIFSIEMVNFYTGPNMYLRFCKPINS